MAGQNRGWTWRGAQVVRREPLMFIGALLSLVAGVIQLVVDGGVTVEAIVPLAVTFVGRWFVSPANPPVE